MSERRADLDHRPLAPSSRELITGVHCSRQGRKVQIIDRILSGGQTGADRAALDAARSCGCAYGGAIPAGRKTEKGPLPDKYHMEELTSDQYPDRTEKNVKDADGTLILSHGNLSGGSALTRRIAANNRKPCLHIDFNETPMLKANERARVWLGKYRIRILNVAGPRASSDPKIYSRTYKLIVSLLGQKHAE